jgi:diaminopimelate epimerase
LTIPFYKIQGTGNDFIIINDFAKTFPNDTSLIIKLCHRRFGIGADGLILMQPPINEGDFFYMQYFNSDGLESSMCGNGGRCIAVFYAMIHNIKDSVEINFSAIDGTHKAHVKRVADNEFDVALQMIDVKKVSINQSNDVVLNTGSPHYVSFDSKIVEHTNIHVDAKKIRYNELYAKEGINVNFVQNITPDHIKIRTYERGVEDETLSCGTGATASAMASVIYNGAVAGRYEIAVDVQGGKLCVRFLYNAVNSHFSDVWLCGPATVVYTGEIKTTFF